MTDKSTTMGPMRIGRTIDVTAADLRTLRDRAVDLDAFAKVACEWARQADAHVAALTAERDELRERCEKLRERCEKLREALRVCMIVEADRHRESDGPKMQCMECRKWWNADDPERHAEGCLAAPKDAP